LTLGNLACAPSKMRIIIVIPCFNLWNQYTKRCLDSIRTSHSHRIVLVDNGSTDETFQEASRLIGPSFVYRRNESNSGTCKAWNWGISRSFEDAADANLALVLNNDVLLHPECIDRLVARMDRGDDRLGVLTAMDVRQEIAGPQALFSMRAEDRAGFAERDGANFSAFMLTRSSWERVGPFDEAFYPAYFEDNDYIYRTRLAGLLTVTLPTALFYHYGCRTQPEAFAAPTVARSAFLRCQDYYIRKWGGTPEAERFRTPFGGRYVEDPQPLGEGAERAGAVRALEL
jgi:GT2 family glycosyltransferase